MKLFKVFRIVLLLAIFVSLAFYSKHQKLKSRSWAEPLQVVIYPINAENSPVTAEYIDTLETAVFAEIDEFFQREGEYYELINPRPFHTRLGGVITEHPPAAPVPGASKWDIIWWGLKFRYWALRHTPDSESNVHRVRVFLDFHESRENRVLQHSVGIDKGLLAIVHAFAAKQQEAQNNIVIAHELLHTVGATDKYDVNNRPVFPDGYAEPDQAPLYPQTKAEIMVGRIPLTASEAVMAKSLKQCLIGEKTAQEINWLGNDEPEARQSQR
ncbi:MAG: hypothetical protein ACU837_03950 [Gammaproteobacteria bacterium]